MKSKKGTEKWTVAKLIKWVMLVILLALVIWGSVSGQLSPLYEKVNAKFDEVLLVLGVTNSDIEAGCTAGENSIGKITLLNGENVDISSGKTIVCRTKCSYELDEEPLLGYPNFSISQDGVSAFRAEGGYPFEMVVPGYDVGISNVDFQEDRELYEDLVEAVNNFEPSSDVGTKEEFLKMLEFSPTSYFTLTVDPNGRRGEVAYYYWDGEEWERSSPETSKSFGDNTEEVLEDVYEYFEDPSYDVYWNYFGDGQSNLPGSGFDVNYAQEDYDEEVLWDWLKGKEAVIDNEDGDADKFEVVIEDGLFDISYYYDREEGSQWRRRRILARNKVVKFREEVFENIMTYNDEEREMYWTFDNESEIHRTLISEEWITEHSGYFGSKFEEFVNESIINFTENRELQQEFMGGLSTHLESTRFDVNRLSIDGRDRIFVYSSIEEADADEDYSIRKGVYRENGEFVFIKHTHDYNDEKINADFGWVYLDDDEFEDFLLIDGIFKFLYDRCGR